MKTSKFAKFSASKLSTKATATITGGGVVTSTKIITDRETRSIREGGRTVGAGMVTEIID